jgi:hypothetical protein
VRAAAVADVEQIRAPAIGNGMFAPEDMAGFDDGLNGYLSGALEGHRWLVATGVEWRERPISVSLLSLSGTAFGTCTSSRRSEPTSTGRGFLAGEARRADAASRG